MTIISEGKAVPIFKNTGIIYSIGPAALIHVKLRKAARIKPGYSTGFTRSLPQLATFIQGQ